MENLLFRNAKEINRLKSRIDETFKNRDSSKEAWGEWSKACEEFHNKYDNLAFPGGLEGSDDRILSGDKITIDTAITFLECRPYFFRSGYIYQNLIRKLKRAPLAGEEKECLKAFMVKYEEYRRRKREDKNG